jgi:hypothetical protein
MTLHLQPEDPSVQVKIEDGVHTTREIARNRAQLEISQAINWIEPLRLTTGVLPIIRHPGKKKLLPRLGSFTLTSTIIPTSRQSP